MDKNTLEETKKHLTSAAIKGNKDKLTGIIENIMINQIAPAGTGAFDLIGNIPRKSKESKTKPRANKAKTSEKAKKPVKSKKKK